MSNKPTKPEVAKCSVCGKYLTRESAQADGVGVRCKHLQAQGFTPEKLAKHRIALTVTAIPEGYIKVAALHKIIKANTAKYPGISVSKMVRAIGKDRGVEPPLHPIAKPLYDSNGHRWVSGWLSTPQGLKALQTLDFSKAPKAG